MSKAFELYGQKKGIKLNKILFLLDGKRIDPGETPETLE